MKAYIVVARTWQYNDNTYDLSAGGEPVKAFRSKIKAEREVLRRTIDAMRIEQRIADSSREQVGRKKDPTLGCSILQYRGGDDEPPITVSPAIFKKFCVASNITVDKTLWTMNISKASDADMERLIKMLDCPLFEVSEVDLDVDAAKEEGDETIRSCKELSGKVRR